MTSRRKLVTILYYREIRAAQTASANIFLFLFFFSLSLPFNMQNLIHSIFSQNVYKLRGSVIEPVLLSTTRIPEHVFGAEYTAKSLRFSSAAD